MTDDQRIGAADDFLEFIGDAPLVIHNAEFDMRFLNAELKKAGRHEVFKPERDFPDDQLNIDYILDNLVICGDVNSVVDQILAFREITGDFGTLLYAGKDWEDKELGKRSMELMAEKVMPAVNAAIGQTEAAE